MLEYTLVREVSRECTHIVYVGPGTRSVAEVTGKKASAVLSALLSEGWQIQACDMLRETYVFVRDYSGDSVTSAKFMAKAML